MTDLGGLVDLEEADVSRPGDVEQHAGGAVERGLEKRRRDGGVRGGGGAALAARRADAHQRGAGVAHDRAHVGEVEVDEPRHGDQVGDPLHALAEDVVGHPERLEDRSRLLDHLQQPVVLDHDQRVDAVAKVLDADLGLVGAALALEGERLRDDADGQRLELATELGNDRRGAGPRATALTGGDEDHVGALERLLQLVAALLRGGEAHLGVRAGAEPARRLGADVDLHVGVRVEQRLRVRVDRDELDAGEPGLDHAVDGVRAAAADPDDLDHCEVVAVLGAHLDLPEGQALIELGKCREWPHSKPGYGLLVDIVNGTLKSRSRQKSRPRPESRGRCRPATGRSGR